MNYQLIYNKLVSGKEHRQKKNGQYYEKHHIIPKSFGGTDESRNLVLLTAKEHFIAHRLLVKIYPNNRGMKYALFNMTRKSYNQKRKLTPRQYEIAKKVMANAASERVGPENHFYGKKHTEEARARMSKNNPRRTGKSNPNYGKRWTQEQKNNLSKKLKGRNMGDLNPMRRPEVREAVSKSKIGEKNPRAKLWRIQNKYTDEIVEFKGGIKPFLDKYPGSTYFKCLKGTDPTWMLI